MTRRSLVIALALALPLSALLALSLSLGRGLPPGEQIAFVSKASAAQWDLRLLDLTRGLAINLTAGLPRPARNRFPVWSPDGDRLLFVSDVTGNQDLLLVDLRSLTLAQVTDWRFNDTDPAWSPAGLPRIAYVTSTGGHWDIGVIALDEGGPLPQQVSADPAALIRRTLGSPGNEFSPAWSPDGRALLYVSDRDGIRDLYLSLPGVGDMLPLTQGMIASDGGLWSPDGERVLFAAGMPGRREVYVIEVATGHLINLSKHMDDDYQPVWSPQGDRVAFVSNRHASADLFMVEVPASMESPVPEPRRLTTSPYPDYEPAWSPDGRHLVYVAAPGFTSELYLLDVDRPGAVPRRLTFNRVEDWYPLWRPTSAASEAGP